MPAPRALVISGYGLNCEAETAHAFEYCGGGADIVHINDLIETPEKLEAYQILAVPGGFSYGDDTGSGKAYANKIRARLLPALETFLKRDTLAIGICNGCQILSNLGLVPGLEEAEKGRRIAVVYNTSNRYQCRWVDVEVANDATSPWLRGIRRLHIPVAHGEGNMVMDAATQAFVEANKLAPMRYITPQGAPAGGEFPYNPNGSTADIAGVTDTTGRVFALMPHPERGMFFTQRDDWPLQKEILTRQGKPLPVEADGVALFRNAVAYFA